MLLVEHAPEVHAERAHEAHRVARRHRQVAAVRRAAVRAPRPGRARRAVGQGLVRLGERLAGTEPQPT